jgi:hypothetical protein
MLAHLRALDPAMSGALLLPAEIDERTGMPAFSWFERARAEAELALTQPVSHSEAELQQAERLDPELGERLRHRTQLHGFFRLNAVMPSVQTHARARRLESVTEVVLTYDRVEPTGLWTRLSLTLSAPRGARDLGCATVAENGEVTLDAGLSHLLSRHGSTPLLALRAGIGAVTVGEVRRLCRCRVGPFWFAGVGLPSAVPASLGRGLLLHLSSERVATDVHHSAERDPLALSLDAKIPDGYGVVRERRFAASGAVRGPLRSWAHAQGFDPEVVPLG